MTKIDFYVLSEGNADTRWQLVCRLVEKAYKNQHRIYLHMEKQADAHRLDEMLWTYREDSFLPHNLYGEGPDPAPPIQIGHNITPEKHRDILVNLSTDVPVFFRQFNRILEVIPNDAALQESARLRFRHYRSQGFEITTHKLESFQV